MLLKKLGWWDDLTEDEKKEAEGKTWANDLSGGIQRVAMKHGCHPFGNAKARAIVWNFPDGIPQHREPLYSPRPDMVEKYPTHDDVKTLWRLPTLFKSVQQKAIKDETHKKFPLILTSGRLVEYEGGGEETRSNPWLAELQQDNFVEINPKTAADRGIRNGEYVWVSTPGIAAASAAQGQGAGHRARRSGHLLHPVPFLGLVAGAGHAALLPGRRRADRARRGGEHRDHLRLRPGDHDAGNQDDALPGREGIRRRRHGQNEIPV